MKVEVPSPSSPPLPTPQHLTPPVDKIAQVCALPPETACTPLERVSTLTGTELDVVVPLPS